MMTHNCYKEYTVLFYEDVLFIKKYLTLENIHTKGQ